MTTRTRGPRRWRSTALGLCALSLCACGATQLSRVGLKPIPSADAAAVTQALNLTTTDLPAYRPAPDISVWQPQAGNAARCLQVQAIHPVAARSSGQFTSQSGIAGGQLSSLATLFRSSDAARHETTVFSSQRAAKCLQSSIREYLAITAAEAHLRLGPAVEVTPLPVTISGAAISFSYRMALTAEPVTPSEQALTVYADLTGFSIGPALIELETYSSTRLFPGGLEQQLTDQLSQRARRLLTIHGA